MSLIMRPCLLLATLCGASAWGQPVVNSVVNSASYFTPPPASAGAAPVTDIAQGSIFVLFGTGMGPSTLLYAPGTPLPTTLPAGNGTSISIVSGGQASASYAAFLVYTSATQVAAILPSIAPTGQATLTLTYNGQTSKPLTMNVAKAAPGIFTQNEQGTGPAAAQVAISGAQPPNNLTTPGTPNSVMVLYGTGFGPISGADNVPPGAVATAANVAVTVGGASATVQYAGRSPTYAGLDQVNIKLPPAVPLGCYVPAVVTVDGIPSNDFTLSTASAIGSCVHPFGLSAQSEAAVDAGGSANVGVFAAIRGAVPPITAEGAGGLFESANASQLYATYATLLTNFHVEYYPAPLGGCVVYDELNGVSTGAPIPQDFTGIGSKELQPAASLTLSGPNNASQGIIRAGNANGSGYLWVNILSALGTPLLGPGTWTLSGAAGPDIAAFSAQTQFPANLTWTNMGSLTPNPQRGGTTISWTGGGTAAQPNVNIFGSASVFNLIDPSLNRGKSFSCVVAASASPFAIPVSITQQLPVAGANEVATGSLGISTGGGSQFNATLSNGTPLDGSFFGFGEAFVNQNVIWK